MNPTPSRKLVVLDAPVEAEAGYLCENNPTSLELFHDALVARIGDRMVWSSRSGHAAIAADLARVICAVGTGGSGERRREADEALRRPADRYRRSALTRIGVFGLKQRPRREPRRRDAIAEPGTRPGGPGSRRLTR